MAATGDEVLDYRTMLDALSRRAHHADPGQRPRDQRLPEYLDDVLAFCDASVRPRAGEPRRRERDVRAARAH